MRRAVLLGTTALCAVAATAALADPGDLNSSFDGDGRKIFGYGGNDAANGTDLPPRLPPIRWHDARIAALTEKPPQARGFL